MGCIAETASFSSLVWWPYACLGMHSIAISLKVGDKQVSYQPFNHFSMGMHYSAENACCKQNIPNTPIKLRIKLFAIHKEIK